MTAGATPAGGGLRALLRQIGVIIRLGRLRRCERGEISAEIADIVIVELFDDGLHLLVLARSRAEEHQLPLDVPVRLPRERWNAFHLRDAVFAMTAGADLCLLLDRLEVGGCRWRGQAD